MSEQTPETLREEVEKLELRTNDILKRRISDLINENRELCEANRFYLDKLEFAERSLRMSEDTVKELQEVRSLLLGANVKQALEISRLKWKEEIRPLSEDCQSQDEMFTGWYWLESQKRLIWYVGSCQKEKDWCYYDTDAIDHKIEKSKLRPCKRVHDLVENSGLGWNWKPPTNTKTEKIQIREGLWLTRGMRKVNVREYVNFFAEQQIFSGEDADRCWSNGDGLVWRRDGRYRDSGLHPHDLVKFLGEVPPLLNTELRAGLWRSRNNKEFRIYHDDRDIQYPLTDGVETWTNEGLYFESKTHYLDLILYAGE